MCRHFSQTPVFTEGENHSDIESKADHRDREAEEEEDESRSAEPDERRCGKQLMRRRSE